MNGDMPHDGGHGGGGHAVGDELKKTGRYEIMNQSNSFYMRMDSYIHLPTNLKLDTERCMTFQTL